VEASTAAIQGQIRRYLKTLREEARRRFLDQGSAWVPDRVIFTERRKGRLKGAFVDRLVLFMRGSGCAWTSQTGGCTFCGFWGATQFGERISDVDSRAQVLAVIDDPAVGFGEYPVICLYNDGSMLVEREVGFDAVLEICTLVASRPHVQRVVIEAKVIDITEAKVRRLVGAMCGKELEIAVGFESASPTVRDLCVNKSFRTQAFEASCRIVAGCGASLVPLIMVKPPFLTEAQAVNDVIDSLAYLEDHGLQRIDLELATVERDTLTHDLWRAGLYSTPWLWSVVAILEARERLSLTTPVFISPPNYTVPSIAMSHNCPDCNSAVIAAMEEYNRSSRASVLTDLHCRCRALWERELAKAPGPGSLIDQVGDIFDELLAHSGAVREEAQS
jgi:radical SAM enzyme (TIGR01210 family)